MPLPPHAVSITGGCNCSAIRYRVHIPPLEDRRLHPSCDPKDPVHLPFVCIDHCNGCRRATGALLGVVLCSPTTYIEISLLPMNKSQPKPDPEASPRHGTEVSPIADTDGSWIPATSLFPPEDEAGESRKDTYLSFYTSSKGRTRAFCAHCGTQFAYSAYPYPDPWPRMLDIWVGSVDQKVLEKEWLVPERHLWFEVGVDWIGKWGSEGSGGVPRHPKYLVSERCE